MESFLLRRSIPKLVLGHLRERVEFHALVERCARDRAEVIAERFARSAASALMFRPSPARSLRKSRAPRGRRPRYLSRC